MCQMLYIKSTYWLNILIHVQMAGVLIKSNLPILVDV